MHLLLGPNKLKVCLLYLLDPLHLLIRLHLYVRVDPFLPSHQQPILPQLQQTLQSLDSQDQRLCALIQDLEEELDE